MKFLARTNFANPEDARVYNRIASRLLPYLILLYIVSFLDRVNVGFAKLGMAADLGLSDTAFGLGAGIFFIGYCLCEIPSNLLLQRFGAKFWMARIMVVWGAISALTMFIPNETWFYIARFALGVAEAGFYPGVVFYLTFWFPARLRSQVCAIFFLGIPLSGVIGGAISGTIMTVFNGAFGVHGWRWLFFVEGVPAVILGVVTYFYLDDGPADACWLVMNDRRLVVSELKREDAARKAAPRSHAFGDAFRNRNVWLMTVSNFALLGSTYGVSFWLPQIVHGLGVRTPVMNGLVTAIPFACAAIAMVWAARHSDRTGKRKIYVIAFSLLCAAGLAMGGGFAHSPALSLIGLSLAMSGALAGLGVLWAVPGTIVTGTAAGAGLALMATIGNLSGYVCPLLIGWISQRTGHLEYGLFLLAGICCVGAMSVFPLRIPEAARTGTPV
jgi:MFS family permease